MGGGVTRLRLTALLLLALAAAAPTQDQLQDAERAKAADIAAQQQALATAAQAAERERQLAQARVEAAAKLQAAEDALATVSSKVADLAQRRADAEAKLAAQAAALGPVLPLFERLSLYPSETLMAVPVPAEQAVRGMLVLGGLARTLEQEAAALRRQREEVVALHDAMDAALPALEQAQAQQANLAQTLDAQLAKTREQRGAAETEAAAAARRASADAAKAGSLRAAIARIEAERQAAEAKAHEDALAAEKRKADAEAQAARARQAALAKPAGAGLNESRSALTPPVAGNVARAFGAPTEAGPASGMSFQAPSRARVVSPCGGRVVFAGPFRSFGLLTIIDCGGGYHFVLSGLDRLDAQVGQAVQPGEPVGVMPDWDPTISGGVGGTARPSLYVELRKDGEAVNPAPFLRSRS